MPVNLTSENYDLWLDPGVHKPERLQPFLRPYPADEMLAYPFRTRANTPGVLLLTDWTEEIGQLREGMGDPGVQKQLGMGRTLHYEFPQAVGAKRIPSRGEGFLVLGDVVD